MPCAFAYASTSLMRRESRALSCKKAKVSESIGKNPQVAPYSGAMFEIVARSASES